MNWNEPFTSRLRWGFKKEFFPPFSGCHVTPWQSCPVKWVHRHWHSQKVQKSEGEPIYSLVSDQVAHAEQTSWQRLQNHWIIDYLKLEGTHKITEANSLLLAEAISFLKVRDGSLHFPRPSVTVCTIIAVGWFLFAGSPLPWNYLNLIFLSL